MSKDIVEIHQTPMHFTLSFARFLKKLAWIGQFLAPPPILEIAVAPV
jgi:hypothetical protein